MRLRKVFVILSSLVGLFYLSWAVFNLYTDSDGYRIRDGETRPMKEHLTQLDVPSPIDCIINDEYHVKCLKDPRQKDPDGMEDEVYFPFSWIKKYYEVTGKMSTQKGKDTFSFQHSYSKVIYPKNVYSSSSSFLWFENFNVEDRDRVKYVSAIHGIPVSSQWDVKGHIYPVQVCQFALAHFSKNQSIAMRDKKDKLVLEDGTLSLHKWTLITSADSEDESKVTPVFNPEPESDDQVLSIKGKVPFKYGSSVTNRPIFQIDIKPTANFSFSIILETDSKTSPLKITYINSDTEVTVKGGFITYGFGSAFNGFKRITRNLMTDYFKSKILLNQKPKSKMNFLKLNRIVFMGSGFIDNVTLSGSDHDAHFFDAASYLINTQDEKGGWPVKVKRKLSNGQLVLPPGWYSAMAQGQAMSVLTRAYSLTNDRRYLDAALRAVHLFQVNSTSHGIRTYFMDKFVWFEEYPTTPSTFVLNGFIYSLFGLFDLKNTCDTNKDKECEFASNLFREGFTSLQSLLPLFDTGSGTVYDLRHYSLKGPPNLARWDYHTTHINQLLFLNTIFNDFHFDATIKRWISYMKGKRSPHN